MTVAVSPRGKKFVVLVDFIQRGPEYVNKSIANKEATCIQERAMSFGNVVKMFLG